MPTSTCEPCYETTPRVSSASSPPDPRSPSDVRQPRRDAGTTYYSKVGFVTRFSEAALIERRVSDTLTLRYVLTVASASSSEDLRELAVEVDKRLLALHP
jgi:hypothetical protein